MAIDASIVNNLRPLAVPDIAKQFREGQDASQQRQLHAQQMQMNAQKIEQETRANEENQKKITEMDKVKQAFIQGGGKKDETLTLARNLGVGPEAYMGLQKHYGDLDKSATETDEKKRKIQDSVNAQLLPLHDQAIEEFQKDPAVFTAKWPSYVATVKQIDPTNADHLDPNKVPSLDDLMFSRAAHQTIDNANKRADQKRAEQKAKEEADKAARDAELHPLQVAVEKGKVAEGVAKSDQEKREQFAREHPEDPAAQQAAMSAKDRAVQAREARIDAEGKRHNLTTEATAKLNAAVAAGRLAQEVTVNGMKYGPGTQEFWVKQLQDNPDSIKEMPPEFRSSVGKKFTEATGLPLPTPASANNITTETAARNALDGVDFIRKTIADHPEIKKRLGAIMGRLGETEQRAGTSFGLSPEEEQLAQELRTRMRYFVFQEGKALLSGRMPQTLMKELEVNSAKPSMDTNMIEGALRAAEGSAKSNMENVDRQRFGGNARTTEMRGANGAVAKTFPAAQVHAYALEHKITDDAAKKAITDAGYAIK